MTRGHSVPLPYRILAGFLVVSLSLPPVAFANPQGGQIRQGQVRIESAQGQLRIHQESQRAVIDWESFSIDRGEVTRFLQPNANAAALNRVRGAAASQIEGMLRANGKVYLINPNGILVGPNGSIDVGGFVGSTLDTTDGDFMRGGDLRFAGNSDAAIINLGSISALDGDVVLMAGSVLNEGRISAPRGTAALAAGNDILLTESGEERVFVRGSGGAKKANGVTNTGEIEANIAELKAHGGNIYGMAVKNEGRVAATGVTRSGGQIFLSAGGGKVRSTGSLKAKRSDGSGGKIKVDSGSTGKTEIGGTVDASGGHAAGGEIAILGREIEVFDGTLILNDGETMGGTTRIGGGRRGEDPAYANAEVVTVGNGVSISASANEIGDGGAVILFSNGSLVFNGFVSAHGGARGGDGGFVELSGKRSVTLPSLTGRLDLSAPLGTSGTLLYDPIDIAILGGNPPGDLSGSPVSQNTLYAGDIADFLTSVGSLIVTTDSLYGEDWGDITMEGIANITWNTANNLTLIADNDFIMDPGAVIYSMGAGAFTVTAARSIVVGNGSSISTTNGNLEISANQQLSPMGGNFVGVSVNGGTVQTLGSGILNVAGRGGDFGAKNVGVRVTAGGGIIGGTAGIQFVTGRGGNSEGSGNIGVEVTGLNSRISTNGANLSVTGFGGGTGSTSGSNSGVLVTSNGLITSGSGSGITVEGTGGGGFGSDNKGIWVSQTGLDAGSIVSGGGFLDLVGIGGGTGSSTNNQGISIDGDDTLVSAAGAPLTLTATGGANTTTGALRVSGTLSTGNQPIQLISDGTEILSTAVINSGSATTTIRQLTNGRAIDLGGSDIAGTTLGLTDAELGRISAGMLWIGNNDTGPITISNTLNISNNLSVLSGQGITFNAGLTMASGRDLDVGAAGSLILASSGMIQSSGTGDVSLDGGGGVRLESNSSIETEDGTVFLYGNADGSVTGQFEGIYIGNGASITSGTGMISLTGKGGDGASGGNHGIRLDTSSLILSLGGDIELDGTAIGAPGSNPSQEGIVLQGDIQTEGSGSISITGRGGNAVGGNIGVNIFNTSQVFTENGTIEITGTSGGGADSPGVQLADFGDSAVAIRSNAGNITIKGESPSALNPGILAFGSGVSVGGGTGNITLESTGTTRFFSGAKIEALGSGSVSLTASRTIFLGAGTRVATENGNLTLSANQQVAPTSGNFAGIHVNGATVESLGTGVVSLTGRGGDSGGNNYGVHLNGGAQVIGGTTNELVITGDGGAGEWAINAGVVVSDSGTLVSSLGGNVILSGTGGTSPTTDGSSGVLITGSSTVTSGTGASVTIVGIGGAGANYNNRGVYIVSPFVSNPTTVSTGGGNLQITGTGGGTSTSIGDHGVEIAYGNSFPSVGSNGGTVTITGYTGPNPLNDGVRVGGNVTTTGNQNIQIYSDRLHITGGASINSGTGTTHILPISSGFQIDVGGADTTTALGVTDGELDRITAGTVLVGSTTSGLVSVSSAITSPNHLMLQSGAGVSVQAAITMAANRNLQITSLGTSNGTISLAGANAALSASGSGLITLISPRDIVLEPGSSLSTVNGNISLSANQGAAPTPGAFSGIDVNGASISTTGTGAVTFSGRGGDGSGGQHGIRLRGGASLTTVGQNLTLSGVSLDPDSSGLSIDLATLGAGGGTIDLSGNGGEVALLATHASAVIGGANDTVLLNSLSGDVNVLARVVASRLQVRDQGGSEEIAFTLTNANNDVDRLNASSNGEGGLIGSLEFRDADGFRVTEFLGASGIRAVNGISLTGAAFGNESIVVDRTISSSGGNVVIKGRDIVVDATGISTGGSGLLTLEAGRAILVQGDSLLAVADGSMELSANRNETSFAGSFTGISILGSRLEATGLGGITLRGTGGNGSLGNDFAYPGFTNPSSNGIRLDGGTVISSVDDESDDFGIELYGSGGGGSSNSVGILIDGVDTAVSSAGRSVLIEGFGGGQPTGQRNRGVLFTGGLIQASNQGNITLFGAGGLGISENDGIQLNGGSRVQAENGAITLEGYAGDTLGIGVMLGNTAGPVSITGTGTISVNGTGRNAEGIVIGNSTASIGGPNASSVSLYANESDLRLQRNLLASGDVFLRAYAGDVFVQGEVDSATGDIEIEGDNLTIDAPVTANGGDITLIFGAQPEIFEGEPEVLEDSPRPPFNGTAAINALLTADGAVSYLGGEGSGDLLTFAGYTHSSIRFSHAALTDIEFVTGTGSSGDILDGPAAAPTTYEFTGPDTFQVGVVTYAAFENVEAGSGNDVFAFDGSATLSGSLNGGGGANTLDYSTYGTGVIIDLPAGSATGIVGGFENIASFTGSGNIDTITGPGSASTYEFTGPDAMQVGSVSVSGFENLIAGPLEDEFIFLPGSSLRGTIDGGFSSTPVVNHLNYSLYGSPVFVNLGGSPLASATAITGGFTNLNQFTGSTLLTDQFFGSNLATSYQITAPNLFSSSLFTATGFENLTGGVSSDTFAFGPGSALSGRLSGGSGAGTDTLDYSLFGRAVTVNVGPNTSTGITGGFSDLERIIGSAGNDRFNFLNQATIQFVDGGGGTDLLEINDSDLGGDHTYEISSNSVSRNPLYTFNNFEALRLFLGRGNNTVNSGFFPYTQFIHGGRGFNTLNLPGVTSLNEGNPIKNVYHYGIAGPRPEGPDTGGLLQLEINQRNSDNPNTQQGFNTENRFSIVDPGTLSQQIGALSGAFAAAITAQASLIVVDGNPYLVFRPFSLDGSGISPSNLAIDALNESLGVDANLELAAAIGYTGPIFLFNPDGAHGLDLSGAPIDPALLTVLQESLAIAAAAELSAALGLNLVVSVTPTDGILPTSLDNSIPGQPVVLLLSEQLGDPAFNELNAALGAN